MESSNLLIYRWDPDANFHRLVLAGSNRGEETGSLRVFDIASGDQTACHWFQGVPTHVSLSADGTVAVVLVEWRGITVIDLDSGEVLGTFSGDSPIEEVAINRGGSLIVAIESTGRLHRLTVDGLDSQTRKNSL